MAILDEDVHREFREWCVEKGVKIHPDIEAKRIPGKGVGVVALRGIKQGTVLIHIPRRALLTIDSQMCWTDEIPRELTVHSTLALALTLSSEENANLIPWFRTWPSVEDVMSTMPLAWSNKQQKILPPIVQELLKDQKRKYDKDIAELGSSLPPSLRDRYTYHWLLVNSRCYYWPHAKLRKPPRGQKALPVDECMALVPWADYFNHAEEGCEFKSTATGCKLFANRDYDEGEEVVVTYGPHTNDYLFVEYGFVMDINRHDCLRLDHVILPRLSKAQCELLEELNFLGKYCFYSNGTCWRTEVAIATLVLPETNVKALAGGFSIAHKDQKKIDSKRVELLEECLELVEGQSNVLSAMKGTPGVAMVLQRLAQMKTFLEDKNCWKAA